MIDVVVYLMFVDDWILVIVLFCFIMVIWLRIVCRWCCIDLLLLWSRMIV